MMSVNAFVSDPAHTRTE